MHWPACRTPTSRRRSGCSGISVARSLLRTSKRMNDVSSAIADAGSTITLRPRPSAPLWLLAMLTFTGTLAMHIFVPALPMAAADLGAGFFAMQMTILAMGQIIYGPVSDRFGRRPALMAGL